MTTVPNTCRIQWSTSRRITSVEGDAPRVLARDAAQLIGRPLAEVLGVPENRANAIDHKARHESDAVEFLPARPREEPTLLRLSLGTHEGDAFAWVLDMHALVGGAPPLQMARLA